MNNEMRDVMVYDLIMFYGNPKGAESYLRLAEALIASGWGKKLILALIPAPKQP